MISFTSILLIIIAIQFVLTVFCVVRGIMTKNWKLAVIPSVAFVIFVTVVCIVMMEFIGSM